MSEVELPIIDCEDESSDDDNTGGFDCEDESSDDDGADTGGFDSDGVGAQSSSDDELYFNFVQHFRKGIQRRSYKIIKIFMHHCY